jgi:peroxiredoxin Q/BCP
MLRVGDIAPDFTLADEKGNEVMLSSFLKKQFVVLIFYPGDQTPVCTKQLCGIRDEYQDFAEAGAVVFGINPGSALSHKKFSEKHDFQFKLLVDKDKSVARKYDVVMMNLGPLAVINRTVYVVGHNGMIIFAQRGTPSNEQILKAIREA